jgi:hypothetical protein
MLQEIDDASVETSLNSKNKNHGDSTKDSKKKIVVPYWFDNGMLYKLFSINFCSLGSFLKILS